MTRTVLTTLTGALLLAVLGGPALAGPTVSPSQERSEGACLRLDPEEGQREGICVYVPITLPLGADR